jgi:hypothetical protein
MHQAAAPDSETFALAARVAFAQNHFREQRYAHGKPGVIARTLKIVGWLLGCLVALGCSAWAFGALHYDFPVWKSAVAWLFGLGLLVAIVFLRGAGKKLGAVFGAFVMVLAWWFTLQPSNERRWQPDVDRTGWAEINGDEVTLHNVRNCDYRTETDYTSSWETRTVRLPQLTHADLAITYWGSPWIAHPIVSFQFADAPPICFSIEARKEIGESYSTIGGFYRQYELIYVMADERDVLRLRTNYRPGEDVFLYRTAMTRANLRERFMEYLTSLNQLHERPRWYNAATTNCTTSIRTQHAEDARAPWDWRILLNGKIDEMLFERRAFVTDGLDFARLKKQALINPVAQAAGDAPDFSRRIREGRAGFSADADRQAAP